MEGSDGMINFNVIDNFGQSTDNKTLGEKIKLEFSIQNSGQGSYLVKTKIYPYLGKDFLSEIINSYVSQTLNFKKFCICDYIFDKQQNIEIIMKKNGKEIITETTLDAIVKAKITEVKYEEGEILKIKAEKLGNSTKLLEVDISCDLNILNNLDYFTSNQVYYFITNNNRILCKSPPIKNDGTFEKNKIPIILLKPNYQLSFYSHKKKCKLISFQKYIDEIERNKTLKLEFPTTKGNYILIDNSKITNK